MNNIYLLMLTFLYYFLPAYVANSSPPLLAKIFPKRFLVPVDNGVKWKGKRLLGNHKSWLGVIGGTLLGGTLFLLQKYWLTQFITTKMIPYSSLPWWFGFLMAFGAIFVGDSGESFFKRRFNIKPGGHWIPFDQIDYTLGAFLVTWLIYWPGWTWFFFLFVVNGLFSAGAHFLAGETKLTDEKL